MMLKVDARGDACPLPVVKAKKAIAELKGAGEVEVLVDNEIAVQNLTKMAQQKGYQYSAGGAGIPCAVHGGERCGSTDRGSACLCTGSPHRYSGGCQLR